MSAIHATCDRAAARQELRAPGAARPYAVLATTIFASSLAFVDGSVVNVALPSIGRSLSVDAAGLQWVINAYLLPLSALLLLGGAAGDGFGRRRLLVIGTLVFAMASLGCAFAPAPILLLASRFVQGVGAAILMPNSLAILGQTFSGEAKGRAIGIWAASGAALGAAGPLLGGWLVDLGSWRAIFLINLPLAAAAIGMGLAFVPRDRVEARRPLDWPGALLATSGLGVLTWALTEGAGRHGWSAGPSVSVVVAALALGLFGWMQRRRGAAAMLPASMFASGPFVALSVLTLLLYGALGCVFVLVPYTLMEAGQYSGLAAGAALMPLPLLIAVTSPTMGGFAARHGAKLQLSAGPLVVACGFLLALRVGERPGYLTEVLPFVLVMAIGMSGAVAPLTTAVLSSVDEAHVGSASGFNSAIARTGGLIGTALLGSVLAAHGAALVHGFHGAMIAGAVCCVGASVSVMVLL